MYFRFHDSVVLLLNRSVERFEEKCAKNQYPPTSRVALKGVAGENSNELRELAEK